MAGRAGRWGITQNNPTNLIGVQKPTESPGFCCITELDSASGDVSIGLEDEIKHWRHRKKKV
tara:strand:- start:330 stop:515 length:186 start_codon:yes stop_codon:yes gene_type:complete